ncbi:MAG TPA: hypothetical protein PLR74_02370 [Agriterribacter sp.]|nr:hypothetical protein [Niabella sp.]HRQ49350.1 hypothetical protein [Agriterribacter sp.]
MKVQTPFQQLLTLVRSLTPAQKAKLRQELNDKPPVQEDIDEFIADILCGPVYSDKEIKVIGENKKSIAAWRTKN